MAKKGTQVNCYVCYGIQVDTSTLHQTMKRFGFDDIYPFVSSHGLDYLPIEETQHPTGYIIGKIIYHGLSFTAAELEIMNDILYINNSNTRLSREEEIEINRKLYQTGLPPFTKYYFAQNFIKNY